MRTIDPNSNGSKKFLKKGEGHAAWSSQLKELKKQKSITLSSELKNNSNKVKLTSYQLQSTGKNEKFNDKEELFSPDDSKDLMEFEKIEKLSESIEKLNHNNANHENNYKQIKNERDCVDLDGSRTFLGERNYFNDDIPYDIPYSGNTKEDELEEEEVQHHYKQSPGRSNGEECDELSSKIVTAKFVPGIKPVHCLNKPKPMPSNSKNLKLNFDKNENNSELPDIYLPEALANGQVMIMTDKLKLWITKLESEIKAFNKKIKEADESKVRYENLLTKLKNENNKEETFLLKAKQDFDEYRDNELKRLKRERKVLDEYQNTLKTLANKKDKTEVERLTTQLNAEKEENDSKIARLNNQLSQSRARINDLEQERTNLRVRITRMEQEILDLQSKLRQSESEKSYRTSYQNSSFASNEVMPSIQSVNQMLYDQLTKLGNITSSLSNKAITNSKNEINELSEMPSNLLKHQHQSPMHGEANDAMSQKSDETLKVKEIPSKFDQRYPKGTIIEEKSNKDGSIETTYSNGLVTVKFSNGSVKEIYPDGQTNVVYFFNGDIKTTYPDGRVIYTYAIDQTMHISFPDNKPDEIHYADGRCEVSAYKLKKPDSSVPLKLGTKETLADDEASKLSKTNLTKSTNCINSSGQNTLEFNEERITPCINRHKTMAPNKTPNNNLLCQIDNFVEIDKDEYLSNYCAKMNLPPGCRGRRNENGNVEIHYPNGQIEIHSCNFKRRIYPDGNTKTIFYDGRQETIYASGRIRVKDALGNLVFDSRTSSHSSSSKPAEPMHFNQQSASSILHVGMVK